jgi:beta-phosphoglucomutase
MSFAVIFDMDGVLVQSLECMVPSCNKVLAQYGVTMRNEDFLPYHGWKLHDVVPHLNKKYGLSLQAEEFAREINAFQFEVLAQAGRSYANEQSLIDDLRCKNVPIAVATASRRSRALKFFEICGYAQFDILVTGEEVQRGKPDPEIFLLAAHKMNYDPARCIVIEDAINGLQAASRAGMKGVGVVSINHSRKDLEPYASLVVDSLEELHYQKLLSLHNGGLR